MFPLKGLGFLSWNISPDLSTTIVPTVQPTSSTTALDDQRTALERKISDTQIAIEDAKESVKALAGEIVALIAGIKALKQIRGQSDRTEEGGERRFYGAHGTRHGCQRAARHGKDSPKQISLSHEV